MAQAQPPRNNSSRASTDAIWEYDFLQLLLEERQMRVERSNQNMYAFPTKSLLIVGNDGFNLVSLRTGDLVDFVNRGGALLVMHELQIRSRARSTDMWELGTFHGGPVTALDARYAYEGYNDCVQVTEIQDREELLAGIGKLITNRADWFTPNTVNNWDWEAVATFPESTAPIREEPKHLMWIGRPNNLSGGMAIVISDSTLLTNNMLWHGDNSRLALRLTEIFKQQGRDRFCFIRNNISLDSVTQRLADELRREQARNTPSPSMPTPKPTWSQLLHVGNVVAKEVAESNVLNEALQRQPRHISRERYFRILVLLLIAAVIAWVIWKVLSSPSLRELWLARRRQRFAYEIQSGNEAGDYRTAASYLAQEFCVQWTGSYYSRHWQQALATLLARQPSVTPEDRQLLTKIVDMASRGCHERMLGPDFQKLGKSIELLRKFVLKSAPA